MTHPNTHKSIEITRLTHDGRGIAKIDGKTTFVTNAVPGDMVTLQITKQQTKFDEARIIEIESPSKDRTKPFCELYEQCGGCQLQHISIEAQRYWKTENFLTRLTQAVNSKNVSIQPAIVGDDTGYRRRARFGLAISKKDKVARLGFRQKESNELIDIDNCPILTPKLNQTLQDHRPQLLENASRAYKDITFVEADNGIFITQANPNSENQNHSKTLNLEPEYNLNDIPLNFPADGFVQVNSELNKTMVQQAIDWLEVTKKDTVLDLFCGVGNFTLPLAKLAKTVTGVEGLQELVTTAEHNSQQNHIENTQFIKANLFDDCTNSSWFRLQKYSRILLDPGRQGAFDLSKVLHILKPQIIVYVSCNAATLIRDIKELEKQGYSLHKAGLIDMFPHTVHTEVMVQLKKSKKPKKQNNKIFRL